MIQWGTVTNTSGSSDWLTQKLPIAYTNTYYKIFLQGRYVDRLDSTPIVKNSNVNYDSFLYYWGNNSNNLNYYTIGY